MINTKCYLAHSTCCTHTITSHRILDSVPLPPPWGLKCVHGTEDTLNLDKHTQRQAGPVQRQERTKLNSSHGIWFLTQRRARMPRTVPAQDSLVLERQGEQRSLPSPFPGQIPGTALALWLATEIRRLLIQDQPRQISPHSFAHFSRLSHVKAHTPLPPCSLPTCSERVSAGRLAAEEAACANRTHAELAPCEREGRAGHAVG